MPTTDVHPPEITMFKKLLAAIGITGAIYWLAKKRKQGDEFEFTDNPEN